MYLGIREQPFKLKITIKHFKANYILKSNIETTLKVIRNYDRENLSKSKEWKRILKKLGVYNTGILFKEIINEHI